MIAVVNRNHNDFHSCNPDYLSLFSYDVVVLLTLLLCVLKIETVDQKVREPYVQDNDAFSTLYELVCIVVDEISR